MKAGAHAAAHQHPHEQIVWMLNGKMDFRIASDERSMGVGDVAVIPGNVEHEGFFPEDTEVIDINLRHHTRLAEQFRPLGTTPGVRHPVFMFVKIASGHAAPDCRHLSSEKYAPLNVGSPDFETWQPTGLQRSKIAAPANDNAPTRARLLVRCRALFRQL